MCPCLYSQHGEVKYKNQELRAIWLDCHRLYMAQAKHSIGHLSAPVDTPEAKMGAVFPPYCHLRLQGECHDQSHTTLSLGVAYSHPIEDRHETS